MRHSTITGKHDLKINSEFLGMEYPTNMDKVQVAKYRLSIYFVSNGLTKHLNAISYGNGNDRQGTKKSILNAVQNFFRSVLLGNMSFVEFQTETDIPDIEQAKELYKMCEYHAKSYDRVFGNIDVYDFLDDDMKIE